MPDWSDSDHGHVHFDLGRCAEAAETFEKTPMHLPQLLYIAAARTKAGDFNFAAQFVAKLQHSHPSFSLQEVARVFHYADTKLQEHLMGGLRKAGLLE